MEMMHAMSMRPKPGKMKKVMHTMELRPAEGGGAVAEHRFTGGHEPETHVFGSDEGKKLAAHVMEHMGMKSGEAEDGPEEDE